ncbi:sucrose-6-phosphate hydrolase [Cellulosimicrobium cellulans]|uniref:hypothetical protein n=1 Tax=Cellulosimicrobium cellulans TaxID=1710 RepID=UPI001EDA7540|nr:hypothetical protein [Cellulosimicrobium cellulans]UKJ64849.1 sucrose-6-phosphate hydrolase [Cellulosimicrobium cellulans]
MAKPYQGEVSRLAETLEWSLEVDISPLKSALQTSLSGPLVAVGSGGSLSAAHALAHFHRIVSGHMSTVLTPLESIAHEQDADTAVWLLSASGGNVDVVNAAKTLVMREPKQLAAFIGRVGSKVATIAQAHPYMDLLEYPPPTGKDGFLATNSLFGATTLLARAYSQLGPDRFPWDEAALRDIRSSVDEHSVLLKQWQEECSALWDRDTTVVLHGASGALGAVDLESKFTEAALGHLQVSDYRNFAHGRHHWLAKRGEQSGVLALIGDEDRDIAERTLALLPTTVPVARIDVPGPTVTASLTSLAAALWITGWAGRTRGIDPGDPGVPEFGRRIYHLAPPRPSRTPLPSGLSRRAAAAIERKSGRSIDELARMHNLKEWVASLRQFERGLAAHPIGAVVLDYDGTVVDTRNRFSPPSSTIVEQFVRLLDAGITIGVATGRGRSVREALQHVLPESLWHRVLVGYYNGAEIGYLDDDLAPMPSKSPLPPLQVVAERLLREPEVAAQSDLEGRAHQLTITSRGTVQGERLWEIVQSVVRDQSTGIKVLRSGHSIDVLDQTASKMNVVDQIRQAGAGGAILGIGDRGRWPGNDHELLAMPVSLSVDQTALSPTTGWNLAAPGQRGPSVTVEYLRAIQIQDDGVARVQMGLLR